MKKLLNSVETSVDEVLEGMVKSYLGIIKRVPDSNVLIHTKKTSKVALISGVAVA